MSRNLGVPARVLLLVVALSIVPAVAHADYVYTVTSAGSSGSRSTLSSALLNRRSPVRELLLRV
jgi:hypothetical protein